MKLSKLALIGAFTLLPASMLAAPICSPLTGASSAYYATDTALSQNCNVIITISAAGTASLQVVNANPYDGNDDNYVGVVNNFSATVGSLTVSGNTDLFGFDGDGIDAFGIPGNPADVSKYGAAAYGGPNVFFTNIGNNNSTGTINFITPLAATNGSSYFSLEEAPSAAAFGTITVGPPVTPEPSSMLLLGTGILGMLAVSRRLTSLRNNE